MEIIWLDYVVMVVYIILNISVGLWASKFSKSEADMLVAGRKIGLYGVVATLVATDWGAITMVYMGESGYALGLAFLAFAWIAFLGYMVIALPGIGTVWIRRLRIMTIPEILEYRFGRFSRALAGITMTLAFLVVLGTFLKGVGGMFGTFFNIDPSAMIVILLGIAIVYTITGGMWSVILTDQLQFLILGLVIPLASVFAVSHVGGWEAMYENLVKVKGEAGVNPLAIGSIGLATIIYQFVYYPFLTLSFPTTLTRVCSARSVREGYKAFVIGTASFFSRVVFPCLVGVAAISLFPKAEGIQAYADTMVRTIPVGITGLLIAGFMAAFMSTSDSYYLTVGAMIPQDVVSPLLRKGEKLSEKQVKLLIRLGVLLTALSALYVAFYYKGGMLYWMIYLAQQMFVAGVGVSILFGLYWKKANEVGSVMALVFGCIGAAVPNYALGRPEWETGLISFAAAILAMIIGSLATQQSNPPKEIVGVRREARALANGLD